MRAQEESLKPQPPAPEALKATATAPADATPPPPKVEDPVKMSKEELQAKFVSKKITKQELNQLKCIENEEMEMIRQMSLQEADRV